MLKNVFEKKMTPIWPCVLFFKHLRPRVDFFENSMYILVQLFMLYIMVVSVLIFFQFQPDAVLYLQVRVWLKASGPG